jgi:hypothetical protein
VTLRIAPPTALAVAVLSVAGCGLAPSLKPDDFSGWQARPLAPDPGLAANASKADACKSRSVFLNQTLPPPFPLPMQVIVQDRRTPSTAAFVVANEGYVGSCLVSPGGESFGYLQEGSVSTLDRGLTVEGSAGGLVGASQAAGVWGRSAAGIASVEIDLGPELHVADDDDRVVTTSVDHGYWIGWWPGSGIGLVITGRDGQGNVVATMKHFDDGWVAQ